MLIANGTGTIIAARVASNENDTWLAVTIAVDDKDGNSLRVEASNKNGLLASFLEDESNVVGRNVAFSGSIMLNKVADSYIKEGQKMVRSKQFPTLRISYALIQRIGAKQKAKPVHVAPVSTEQEVVQSAPF